jgi:hypothetical protein
MSKELKRYGIDPDIHLSHPCLDISEDKQGEWVKYEDVESQLNAQSAHIEELGGYLAKIKPVLQTIAMDRGKGSKADVLFSELLALLNQSPATSLEQVKREAKMQGAEEALMSMAKDLEKHKNTAEQQGDKSFSLTLQFALRMTNEYANNLKEKG